MGEPEAVTVERRRGKFLSLLPAKSIRGFPVVKESYDPFFFGTQ